MGQLPDRGVESTGGDPDLGEFKRRLAFWRENFRVARGQIGSQSFNASLKQLNRELRTGAVDPSTPRDLQLSVVINVFARRPTGKLDGRALYAAEWQSGASKAAAQLKPVRGRPKDHVLWYHVEALMALLYETRGRHPRAVLYKNSVYDPQAVDQFSQLVIDEVRRIDRSIAPITIIDIMVKAEKKRDEWPIRFTDYFPVYGATIVPHGPEGPPDLAPGSVRFILVNTPLGHA